MADTSELRDAIRLSADDIVGRMKSRFVRYNERFYGEGEVRKAVREAYLAGRLDADQDPARSNSEAEQS